MLEYVAAANAAYSVIRTAISNGRELTDCAKSISAFTLAHDDLKNAHNKKKNSIWSQFSGKKDDDLESFMYLEQLKQKEAELKQLMIYYGRPGLHQDWVRFQVEARKRRQEEAKERKRKQAELKETLENVALVFLVLVFLSVVLGFFVWVAHRKGVI